MSTSRQGRTQWNCSCCSTGCTAAEVINGLAYLAPRRLLPVQMQGSAFPLRDTLAGMLVLAARARVPEDILASRPEALLALLWILEGYNM